MHDYVTGGTLHANFVSIGAGVYDFLIYLI